MFFSLPYIDGIPSTFLHTDDIYNDWENAIVWQ